MKGSRAKTTGLGLVIIVANVLLVTIVAIGISERGFSGWWDTVRGEWENPLDLEIDDPFAEEDPDDAVVTTAPPTTPDDAAMTTAPPTEEATEDPDLPRVAERYEAGDDLTVLVLGDQTGTDTNDWVGAWSRMLATDRLVELRSPTAADPTQYGPAIPLGSGDSAIGLYNASLIGGTPGYAAERLTLLAPEEPDLVLLNYGRSNDPDDLPGELDALWGALSEQFPDAEAWVVVAPQRTDGLEATVQTTRDWAADVEAPVVDVARVFDDEGLTWTTVSTRDPLSVNIFGGERWAQIVHETVMGDIPQTPVVAPVGAPEPEVPTDVAQPEPELPPVDPGNPPVNPVPAPVDPGPPAYQPPAPPPYQPPPYQPLPAPTPTPTPTPTPEPPPPSEPPPSDPPTTPPTLPPPEPDPIEPGDTDPDPGPDDRTR